MTADEAAAATAMYQAAGVVVRELGPVLDALARFEETPIVDVADVIDVALARCRRAWEAAAAVRERYG